MLLKGHFGARLLHGLCTSSADGDPLLAMTDVRYPRLESVGWFTFGGRVRATNQYGKVTQPRWHLKPIPAYVRSAANHPLQTQAYHATVAETDSGKSLYE